MSHSSRNDLRFVLGVSTTPGATEPEFKHDVYFMRHSGGDHPIRGLSPEFLHPTIEFALRADKLVEYIGDSSNPKFYLTIVDDERGDIIGEGKIESFSVVDCRDEDNVTELVCDYEYVPILANKDKSLSVRMVDYDFEKEGLAYKVAIDEENNYDVIIDSPENINVTIDILDSDKKIVKTLVDKKLISGFSRYKINKSDLSQGVYAVRIFTHKQIVFRQIYIQ